VLNELFDCGCFAHFVFDMELALTDDMDLRSTLRMLPLVEKKPESRFWFGSPCRFIRTLDVLVHIVLPEAIESIFPRTAKYLRTTSPRWGRSWRRW